jgi:CRP/FNR family transcriptional regulator
MLNLRTQTKIQKTSDKIAAIRKTDLFGNLPDSILQAIAARAVGRQLERGTVLYCEHETVSALYVVCSGELRLVRQNTAGREQVLSTERAGAILADVPAFDGGNSYSTAIADTYSEILSIETRDIRDLCRKHPEILWNVVSVLAQRVRNSAEVIETLALRNVDQRVAQYLLVVCQERGVPAGNSCVVELTMSRAGIASRLGSTREVVSRAFTHLENAGMIQIQGRRLVTITDTRRLGAFAGSEAILQRAS